MEEPEYIIDQGHDFVGCTCEHDYVDHGFDVCKVEDCECYGHWIEE